MDGRSIVVASACAISASALTYLACKYVSRRGLAQSKASQAIYETETLGQVLSQHYGKPEELLPYGFGPVDSLGYPIQCALECIKYTEVSEKKIMHQLGNTESPSSVDLKCKDYRGIRVTDIVTVVNFLHLLP